MNYLSIFALFAALLHYVPQWHNPTLLFIVSAIAIIPAAGWMGKATEHLAAKMGAGIGGLLNATFGNMAELIIAGIALSKGMTDVVKASLTGSIVGNLLLVLGASIFAGGIKHKTQKFNVSASRAMASVLVLAAVALIIPTVFHFSAADKWSKGMEVKLSLFIAVILIVSYATLLLFSLKTHKSLFSDNESVDEVLDNDDTEHGHTPWSTKKSIWVLVGATTMVAILSEYLVSSVEFAGHALGLTPVFVGVIVVAIIGNAAEHSTAIFMARKNKMNLAFNIAVGSSIQIALFVAPVLVFISHLLGAPIDLEFSLAEVVSVGAAVYLTSQVCNDGECNWFEGFQLLAVYAIIAVLFYYLPVS